MSNGPNLVEPDVLYFINNSLKNAHEYKMNTYSFFLNVIVCAVFFLVFGGILYYKYKSKLTPYEIQQKMKIEQEIVMSKIKLFQDDKVRGSYTDMVRKPFVDTDYYLRNLPQNN